MKKLRIAVVVRSLKIGGMERVALSLTRAFQDEGHDAHLIYFKYKKNHLNVDGLKSVHFWDLNKISAKTGIGFIYDIFARILNLVIRQSYFVWNGFLTSKIFQTKLKKLENDIGKFDLIIIRGQGSFELIYSNQDSRYVQVCENILYPDQKMTFKQKIFVKLLYKDKNIACVSDGVLKSFNELEKEVEFSAKKSLKITNPIDIKYIQKASDEYIPDIKTPYIVNVGRLAPVKQLPLLIDAFLYIKKKYKIKHQLVLVGAGHDEENIKNKLASLADKSIILAGSSINPYPWIKNAELFVLSSKHEGLGMVLLEALACKTNLVVTKSKGGVVDIMKNELESLLCEQNIESLGEKIYEQITTPQDIDFDKHLEEFLPQNITNKYIKNFYEV
jgi:glycosyltransferase involved in cell wall biosynthesis